MLIESGSHVPGVDVAGFGLLPYTALRYEVPSPDLAHSIADIHVLDSAPPPGARASEWMLPNTPAIRFILADHPMALTLGAEPGVPLPRAAFYGPTSRAAEMRVGQGGVTIGVNLTATGVARLFGMDAAGTRDRVMPLDTLLPADWVEELSQALLGHDRGRAAKRLIEEALRPLLRERHPLEGDIRKIAALLIKPGVVNLLDAAEEIGIHKRRLERLTRRFFGFPPKLLLRRARFLRSLVAVKLAGVPYDYSLIDPAYYDQSHFIRDAHRFLGMRPSAFLQIETPFLDSLLRARAMVHGAALASLDQPRRG